MHNTNDKHNAEKSIKNYSPTNNQAKYFFFIFNEFEIFLSDYGGIFSDFFFQF